MALNRSTRYPGRFATATSAHPQGAFKNRTSPTSQDGSYLEADWANDWDGFFGSLLSAAGLTPNGNVDAVGASQYYSALSTLFRLASTTVPISGGGTGATTASAARTNLGLGTAALATVGTGTNQVPDMNSFTSTLAATGWQKLPGGLIIQWGRVAATTGDAATSVTFPVAFTTTLFNVQASFGYLGSTANIGVVAEVVAPTLTGVTLNRQDIGSIFSVPTGFIYWMAMGV